MADADILERPLLVVGEGFVDLIQRPTWFLTLYHCPKWCMLSVQIVDLVLKRYEELRPRQQLPFLLSFLFRCLTPAALAETRKRNRPLPRMPQLLPRRLWLEERILDPGPGARRKLRPNACSTFARIGRIARLG